MDGRDLFMIAAAGGLAWLFTRSPDDIARFVSGTTAGVVGAAGGTATGIGTGVVLGISDVLGVPRTDAERCAAAKRAGEIWNASKYCGAGDFIGTLPELLGRKVGLI